MMEDRRSRRRTTWTMSTRTEEQEHRECRARRHGAVRFRGMTDSDKRSWLAKKSREVFDSGLDEWHHMMLNDLWLDNPQMAIPEGVLRQSLSPAR